MKMNIGEARRIAHFVDDFGMSDERLAKQLGCSVNEARQIYVNAKHSVQVADARNAIAELKRLAAVFNVSTYEMLTLFA